MRDWPKHITRRYDRAVFLDRDGTVNVDTHYPYAIEDLELLPGSIEGLRILSGLPLHIIVASNQAGIALGYFTQPQMSAFNREIRSRIEREGGRIDAFYFCPYPESKDLPPGAPTHDCLKPSPGMLIEAARDYCLDLGRSYVVGDKSSDIEAGDAVGCATILVRAGKTGNKDDSRNVKASHDVHNLVEAARVIESLVMRAGKNRQSRQE